MFKKLLTKNLFDLGIWTQTESVQFVNESDLGTGSIDSLNVPNNIT